MQRRGPDGSYRDAGVLASYGRAFDPSRILFKNDIPLIALMHRRELVEKAGPFDEAFDLFEDWDFLIRLSRVTRLRFVPETTALYRLRDDGSNATTASPWRECYDPQHPMTRTESRQFKMDLLRFVSEECGLVTGSETGHEAAVPYVHYFEGMLSLGPYRVPDSGRDMQRMLD